MTAEKTSIGRIGPPATEEQMERVRHAVENARYFERRYDELAQKYPHKWVAVLNGEVVLVADDHREFGRALREQGLVGTAVQARYIDPDPLPMIPTFRGIE